MDQKKRARVVSAGLKPLDEVPRGMAAVKILGASICGTDGRLIKNDKKCAVPPRLIPGHEGGGVVLAVGDGTSGLRVGDIVCVLPHWPCGRADCAACQRGLTNQCPRMEHAGLDFHGVFTTYGTYPVETLYPLGRAFSHDALPLIEPLSCVLRAMSRVPALRRARAGRPLTVCVRGAGPQGCLLALATRRYLGPCTVWMVEPNPIRRNVVTMLGIGDHVVDRLPDGVQPELSFVATSSLAAYQAGIAATAPGGVVICYAGINTSDWDAGGDEAGLCERVHRRELVEAYQGRTLIGSSGYTRADVDRAVNELIENSRFWSLIQNVIIEGIWSHQATYLGPPRREVVPFPCPAVEAYLDPTFACTTAQAIKVLIRPQGASS